MYYQLSDPAFWLYFALFFGAAFVSWIIPGWVTLYSLKIKDSVLRLLLSLPVGLSLWGLQAYVFGYTHLRFLTYGYSAVFGLLFLYQLRNTWRSVGATVLTKLKRQPLWLILAIIVSSIIQIFGHIGSGLLNNDGLKFYFVNAADGIMHLSYIQSLKTTFPPFEPGAAGEALANYHYWSDLILADLARIWGIPIIHLFFQYVPILFAVWTTVLFVKLIAALGGTTKTKIVALFLLTFGSDAAYIMTELLHHTGDSHVASLDSGVTFFFNFPQVVARLVFLGVLLLLIEFYKTKKLIFSVIASILIATLFGFKIYYGIYALLGFGFLVAFEILRFFIASLKKHSVPAAVQTTFSKYLPQVLLLALATIIALAIYLPANKGAGGLTYDFLEWPHHLLSFDNLDYQNWFQRMQVYEAAHNWRDIFIFNTLAIVISFIMIYGTRMLGFLPFSFLKKSNLNQTLAWFFIPTDIIFIIIGLLTVQTSGDLNIYNFLIVPILSFNIFAAFTLGNLPTKIFVPVFVIFCVLTLPRPLSQLQQYWTSYASGKADLALSQPELDAYSYLRQTAQPGDIVQALPTNLPDQLTPYVAFMSGQPSYIAGVNMLESHNQPTKERLATLKMALAEPNIVQRNQDLKQLGIKYLILRPEEMAGLGYHESDTVYLSATTAVIIVK